MSKAFAYVTVYIRNLANKKQVTKSKTRKNSSLNISQQQKNQTSLVYKFQWHCTESTVYSFYSNFIKLFFLNYQLMTNMLIIYQQEIEGLNRKWETHDTSSISNSRKYMPILSLTNLQIIVQYGGLNPTSNSLWRILIHSSRLVHMQS